MAGSFRVAEAFLGGRVILSGGDVLAGGDVLSGGIIFYFLCFISRFGQRRHLLLMLYQ